MLKTLTICGLSLCMVVSLSETASAFPPPGKDGEKKDGARRGPGERDGKGRPGKPGEGDRGKGRPGGGQGPEMMFKRIDKNGDKAITKDEAPGRMWERLSMADADKNGSVTIDELKAAMKKRMEGRGKGKPGEGRPGQGNKGEMLFKRFDKNGDNAVSKDEVPAELWEKLSKADANGNGSVDAAELKAAHQKRMEGAQGRPGKGKPGPKGDGEGKPRRPRPEAE